MEPICRRIVFILCQWTTKIYLNLNLNNFLVPMHGKFGRLSPGKRPSIIIYIPMCSVFVFHTAGSEAYIFRKDVHEIFNVRIHVGACRTHEWGSDTNKCAQQLARRDTKCFPHPTRGSNPGSSYWKFDALTSELRTCPVLKPFTYGCKSFAKRSAHFNGKYVNTS